jgi:hypothetical protein
MLVLKEKIKWQENIKSILQLVALYHCEGWGFPPQMVFVFQWLSMVMSSPISRDFSPSRLYQLQHIQPFGIQAIAQEEVTVNTKNGNKILSTSQCLLKQNRWCNFHVTRTLSKEECCLQQRSPLQGYYSSNAMA